MATCFEQANEYFQAISNTCKFLLGKEELIRAELNLPSIAENSPLSNLENLTKLYGYTMQYVEYNYSNKHAASEETSTALWNTKVFIV